MQTVRRAVTLSLAAALFLGAAGLANAEVRASLSQDQVAEGDTFVLNLQSDAEGAPDLAPLSQDFEVLGTSQSTSVQVINGRVSQTAGWTITLAPKTTGKLTIPPISVGSETSVPLSIEVVDAASIPRTNLADNGIEVEMSAETGTHYVQQEIPLTVKILASADIQSAELSEPSSPDAVITRTGDDRTSRVTMGGRPVTVIERDYLLKPQKSGTLTLSPVILRARVPDPNARSPFGGMGMGGMGDPFARMRQQFGMNMPGFGSSLFDDMMNPGREVVARSQPVTLDIAARPGASTGWFLPAKNVEVRAAWQPASPDFKSGEAFRRIVQIVALGASKEQLPDLTFADVDGAQVYVERVDDQSKDTADGTAAIKQYTLSVVPTHGGEITLPAIDVNWLNSATGKEEIATLPAETLLVSGPAADETNAPAKTAAAAPSAQKPATSLLDNLSGTTLVAVTGGAALVLLAGIGLAVANARRRSRSVPRPATRTAAAAAPQAAARKARAEELAARRSAAEAAVRTGCRRGDARAAFNALTEWLRLVEATPQTLAAPSAPRLAAPSAPRLAEALGDLEGRLYGPEAGGKWDGRPLLAAFEKVLAERAANARGPRPVGDLPPLYAADPRAA